jgi:hypothetical protein
MKRLLLSGVLVLAGFTVACSGGSIAPAPPPTGGFTNSNLKGSYTFSMSGADAGGGPSVGAPVSRIGSFTADGNGAITAGLYDVNESGSVNTITLLPSTYSIQSNGQGTLTLAISSTVALKFSIALSSNSQGFMIETDGGFAGSGGFQAQTISTTFSPSYAFDFSGSDITSNGGSVSLIGQFNTNGTNLITGGSLDVNDDATLSGQQSITSVGLLQDSANFSTFGRGTFTLNGLPFVFYVTDGSHMVCLEGFDTTFATVGSAIAQTSVPTNTSGLNGSFVFLVGGGAIANNSTLGPLTRAGRFTSDGTGNLTNINLDQNYSGTHKTFPQSTATSPSITIDPAGSGRGTVQFTDSSSGQVFSYIFYLYSASSGFIQDVGNLDIADGSIYLQSGSPFTTSSLAGKFIANWSGINGNNSFEEDFVTQFTLSSATSSNISGSVDYVELGASNNQIVTGAALTGTLTINGDGTLGGSKANTAVIQAGGQNFNFNAYIIDNKSILLIGTDNAHVVLGTVINQP